MKILKLKFKNLNSLENENTINFEEAPFSDTGVFAITGANGSGKSTLLDAITLGLYGETFRFDRPAGHVMTKHSAESYAEIEFSIGNNKYRSSWHVQRLAGDPDGELMPTEMKLARLSGGGEEILAATPQLVCSKITDITGMNFRSFTRSILLAQGDFAAFLNALDNERMGILEKIISTDIYADYRKEIIDKAENAQKTLDYLKQDLSLIPLLDPIKRETCEHDLIDFKEQYTEFQLQNNALKQQQAALTGIAAIESRIAEQEVGLKALQLEAETEQQKLDSLEAGQIALNFQEDMEALTTANQAIRQGKETLTAFKSELKQLENRLTELNSDPNSIAGLENLSFTEQQQAIAKSRAQVNLLNSNRHAAIQLAQSLGLQTKEKSSDLAAVSSWLEEHAVDQLLVDSFPEIARLKNLKEEIAELSEKQKALRKSTIKAASVQKNTTSALEKQQKTGEELKLKLSLEEDEFEKLARGKTLEEIQELRLEQQERVISVREVNKLADAHQKLCGYRGFWGIFKSKEVPDMDAEALTVDLESLRQEIKREENIKLALDELVFGELLRNKMAADRHHLFDGKPCPLCGSLQHPYAKNPPAPTNSQQALEDQQAKLKALKSQAETTERNIVVAKKQAEINKAKQNRLLQIRSQWLTLCNRLNLASQELDINNKKLMKQLLKNEIIELTEISSLAAKYRNKQKTIEKLKTMIARTAVTVEQLQTNGHQMASESQSRSQAEIDNDAVLSARRQEEKELSEKVLEQLTLLGETAPVKGKEDALLERLNRRRNDYQTNDSRHKSLIAELAGLAEKETACQTEIKDCDDKLRLYSGQLESEETTGLHLALIEKQKLIVDREQFIAMQETEAGRLQQKIQEKMRGTEFTHLDQIGEILTAMQTRPALEQRKAELDQMVQVKAQELEKGQAQLNAEHQGITGLSMAEVSVQLRSVNEKMDIAYQEALRLENLLKDQDRLQQKHDAVLLQLKDQEALVRQYFDDKALLDAEQGMAFRRRVQNQIADKLLSQTNAILEKISGRYYLRQAPSEQGLALEIEDTYQANARRLPKTLSGGESFVVSLALALGLSELANNGKSVDSLFLDEGFGNLDAETLYAVVSTLESLHTHGKTVGVISHVEAVQKRFKAQLQLIKKPNGMGMLKKAS